MVFTIVIVILIVVTIVRYVTTWLYCPLAHVPGPWHTRLTNLSLRLAIIKGRRIHHVHALHEQYGPIVRLSPTEVDVADVPALAQIHRVGTPFVKSRWYESTHPERDPGIFAMRDPAQHAQRRRLFARAFSYTSLAAFWEATVREKVTLAVKRIRECAVQDKNGADTMKWWTLMATDVIAHLAFGESFKMLELGRQTEYIDGVQNALLLSVIRFEIPIVWHILRWMPVKKVKALMQAENLVFEHGSKAVRYMKQEGERGSSGTKNLFGQMMAVAEKSDGIITDEDVKNEAANLIIAGSDTTAVTLTYLCWAVLKHPALQKELEEEVAGLSEELSLEELKNAPLLNSIIEETLRLYGAAPGALPRIVPPGGAVLCNYNIPGGIEVTTQAFTLHRDPNIWSNPLTFNGYRFMDKSTMTSEQKNALHPFGAGARVCIGNHLAWMELRLGAALFFRNCQGARLADNMTDEMMEMVNRFLISPKGHCCNIVV